MKFTRRDIQILQEWCLDRNHARIQFSAEFLMWIRKHMIDTESMGHTRNWPNLWEEMVMIPDEAIPFKTVLLALTTNTGMEDGPTPKLYEKIKMEMNK